MMQFEVVTDRPKARGGNTSRYAELLRAVAQTATDGGAVKMAVTKQEHYKILQSLYHMRRRHTPDLRIRTRFVNDEAYFWAEARSKNERRATKVPA